MKKSPHRKSHKHGDGCFSPNRRHGASLTFLIWPGLSLRRCISAKTSHACFIQIPTFCALVQKRWSPRNAMSATPRLRSGFPATPGTTAPRRHSRLQESPTTPSSVSSAGGSSTRSPRLPQAPENVTASQAGSQPVIPLTILDGPQQRFYAFGIYVLLWAWKLYDWLQVVEDGDASWALFLKWILIDFAFLFGLPELRIPWLELSQFLVTGIFTSHLIVNYMLMFNIPVRIFSVLPLPLTPVLIL